MSSRAFLCVLAIAALLVGSAALFQDEVGVFDWTKENVGVVSRAVFPANAKNVFVATDGGVLASLQLKTGAIQWRRVLADGNI